MNFLLMVPQILLVVPQILLEQTDRVQPHLVPRDRVQHHLVVDMQQVLLGQMDMVYLKRECKQKVN